MSEPLVTIRIENPSGQPLYIHGGVTVEIPPFTWIDSDGKSGRTVIEGGCADSPDGVLDPGHG